MLIACKCLNFVGSTGQIDQKLTLSNNEETKNDSNCLANVLAKELKEQQLNRRFSYNCLEFLRQASGPISDLSTTIIQNDLIFKVPLETWILYYCINCNSITHAKHKNEQIYLINSKLLTNKAEINSLKISKSFSTAFNILMIDHQPTTPVQTNDLPPQSGSITTPSISSNENIFTFPISNNINNVLNPFITPTSSTLNNEFNNLPTPVKIQHQKRLRNLNHMLQQRLQKEIRDTDERIRRFSEQQFVLLKNFREKTEQEYNLLVSLVNQVPEDLKVIDAIDDNTMLTPNNTMKTNDSTDSDSLIKDDNLATNEKGAIDNTNRLDDINDKQEKPPSVLVFNKSVNDNQQELQQPRKQNQSQIPNIETPPGTPENVPMSVGNSPTFRSQQQNNMFSNNQQQQRSNFNDDCLFEIDDFEVYEGTDQPQNMSDVEECEDAADALGELTSAMAIPKNMGRRGSNSIAKSLPIKIANMGPNQAKYDYEDLEDEGAEDTVDIAASIKALAKSVHGNTIFGELPRPRFSTQI